MPSDNLDQLLEDFLTNTAELAEAFLRTYNDQLTSSPRPRAKELNDPVWGTVSLTPAEVVVLDSPLLQRLRRIRQLGVVHLVFPGGTHTRFDHSVGLVSRVTALIDAINTTSPSTPGLAKPISTPWRQVIRLAALCHDIGHGFMSHVSEKAIDGNPRINKLQRHFSTTYGVENPQLSEMIAFAAIRSESFSRLLRQAWGSDLALPEGVTSLSESISDVVVGRTVSDDFPLLHELVSGPFDADKLDYLTRDAYYCGVPQVVDIPRLIQKIRVARTTRENLPTEIADKVAGGTNRVYAVTAVAWSGASTLDELALGRALLHDKVYRHKKVRAAEAMVASVLNLLSAHHSEPEQLILSLHDEEFLDLGEHRLGELLSLSSEDFPEELATAIDIVQRLRERQLFVRAIAWSQTPTAIGHDTEEEQTELLHDMLLDLRRSQRRLEVTRLIADRTADILTLLESLGSSIDSEDIPKAQLTSYIRIDPPSIPKGRELLTRAYLQDHQGLLHRFGDVYPDTEGWSDQYLVNREVGYVFTPRPLASVVHLATEEVFRTEFGVRVSGGPSRADSVVPSDVVHGLRSQLSEAGYYDGKPSDLLPVPQILTTAGSEQRLDEIIKRARNYSSPLRADGDAGLDQSPRLTRDVLTDFLRQFRKEEFVEEAVGLLSRIRFLGRSDIVQSVESYLQNHTEFRNGYVCALGGAKDSSAVHTYIAGDLAEQHGLKVVNIAELPEDASHVLFVDDFIGSGRQAVDIVEAWLNEERTEDLGEERAPLTARVADTLRGATVGFSLAAGFEEGKQRLQARLEELELENVVSIHLAEDSLPFAFDAGILGETSEAFQEECKRIGQALLESDGQDPSTAAGRALGYGNRGLLLVLPFNTPAQTLTLLWKTGVVDDLKWKAPFPRRRKR